MPIGSGREKRPADVITNAVHVVRIATKETGEEYVNAGRSAGGRKGGKACAAAMSAGRRRGIVQAGAAVRRGSGESGNLKEADTPTPDTRHPTPDTRQLSISAKDSGRMNGPATGPNWSARTIWTGDSPDVMRGMNSTSVDLIHLDPPFNSKANCAAPVGSRAAGAAFRDTRRPDGVNVARRGEIKHEHPGLYSPLQAIRSIRGDSMMSCLIHMANRVMEMRRLLKPAGSICPHRGPDLSHYLELLMDSVFGKERFRNDVAWRYGRMSDNRLKRFTRCHDIKPTFVQRMIWSGVSANPKITGSTGSGGDGPPPRVHVPHHAERVLHGPDDGQVHHDQARCEEARDRRPHQRLGARLLRTCEGLRRVAGRRSGSGHGHGTRLHRRHRTGAPDQGIDGVLGCLYQLECVVLLKDAHKYQLGVSVIEALGADFGQVVQQVGNPDAVNGVFFQGYLYKDKIGAPALDWAKDLLLTYLAEDELPKEDNPTHFYYSGSSTT